MQQCTKHYIHRRTTQNFVLIVTPRWSPVLKGERSDMRHVSQPPPFPPDVHPGTFRGKGSQAEVPNPGPGPKAWARARETQGSIRYLRIEPRLRERWTLSIFLTHSIEAGAYPSRHCTPFHRGSVLSAGRIRHHNGRTAASRDSGKKSVSTHTDDWGSHRRRQTVPCAHRSHPC